MTHYRPTYETDDHLKKEEELAQFAAFRWNCKMRKQDKYNQFDYIAIKDKKIDAFVELRCRNNSIHKYPSCFITVNKLYNAHAIHQATGVKVLFLVGWDDRTGVADLTKQYPVALGGRVDRDDPADIEIVAEIPISSFIVFT